MKRRFAILIGVETYDDKRIAPVDFAANDVLALGDVLAERCGFDTVHRLCAGGDAAPTFNNISFLLEDAAKELDEDDLLFFHASAHGVEVGQQRYILTADTPFTRYSRGIPLTDLTRWLGDVDALRRAIVLDICRNDPAADRASGGDNMMSPDLSRDIATLASPVMASGTKPQNERPDPTNAILSACKPGQRAYGWERHQHGVLTHYLLHHLRQGHDALDFTTLANRAHRDVEKWSDKDSAGRRQTLWYEPQGPPRSILIRPEKEHRASSVAVHTPRSAQLAITQTRRFTSDVPSDSVLFGKVISVTENRLVVAAPYQTVAGQKYAGAVFSFDRHTGQMIYKITSDVPQENTWFGTHVHILGDDLVVAVSGENVSGRHQAGAVYLFDLDTGRMQRKLRADTPQAGARFGDTIETTDDYLVIGAPRETVKGKENAGAVYIFDRRTGDLLHKITSSKISMESEFGGRFTVANGYLFVHAYLSLHERKTGRIYVIDLHTGRVIRRLRPDRSTHFVGSGRRFGLPALADENSLVIGSPGEHFGHSRDVGVVYVFDFNTGQVVHKLTAYDPQEGAGFGESIEVVGDLLVVGAPGENIDGKEKAGAVYLFNRNTGQMIRRITADAPQERMEFGERGAIFTIEDHIIIRVYREAVDGQPEAGAVYLFDRHSGHKIQRFTADAPRAGAYFGWSVETDGDRLIIGAPGSVIRVSRQVGEVFLFDRHTGRLIQKFTSDMPQIGAKFGSSITVDRGHLIIGAMSETVDSREEAGALYQFRLVDNAVAPSEAAS